MYKQTFFAAVSILLSLPMLSQQGYASQHSRTAEIASKVHSAVVQKVTGLPEWLRALKQEENKANQTGYLGYRTYGMFTTTFRQHPVTADKDLYNMRKHMLQNELKGFLAAYTFYATEPEMLSDLSVTNFGHLFGLVQAMAAGEELDPVFIPEVSKPENAVIQVTFTAEDNIQFILRIDAFQKRIYFFTNAN